MPSAFLIDFYISKSVIILQIGNLGLIINESIRGSTFIF